MKKIILGLVAVALVNVSAWAQTFQEDRSKFEQLGSMLPTPNSYRSASGAPGPAYWQQRADYDIKVELDDEKQRIAGTETITYFNNSPDELGYLWLQLEQNIFDKNSDANLSRTSGLKDTMTFSQLDMLVAENFDGGYKVDWVKDKSGNPLRYTINGTMMRVEMPRALKPKGSFAFSVSWSYNVHDHVKFGRLPGNGRMGYEFFPKDGNYLYEIAQFFPRMAVYDDVYGWQHKQFLGNGEFTLPFGNYKVAITVPADHVLGATGTLKNPGQVLTAAQQSRLDKARGSDKPVVIVTQEEAAEAEKQKAAKKKTWVFEADNVRDFAFATSRKFIWDAMAVTVEGKKVLAMSYYPKEANPLWGKYSTQAVAHTLRSYSKRTIAYPYPVAISVHGPVGGMEYPMISFNGYRPEPDGTYSEQIKYGLISVVIHEVGHNFFPMIINSDERQWTWMDEGLNSFCQYLAEQEWQRDYPSRRGEPYKIVPYMSMAQTALEPIMTNSEQVSQLGNNAYGKPATALNILRETVMGRDLFDYAFKEYARRWAFKHPHPADFFRTMEDASGVDLDWFWRGWFYGTEPVELSLENVDWMQINSQNPDKEKPLAKAESEKKTISQLRNAEQIKTTVVDQNPELKDFYNTYDPHEVTAADKARFDRYYGSLSPEEKKLIDSGENFYTLTLKNNGGLVMPVILKMDFEDGTNEVLRIPAQVWRMNNKQIVKTLHFPKKVVQFTLDPFLETADINTENNAWPRVQAPSRFQLYRQRTVKPQNPMQQQREAAGQSNR